MRIDTSHTGSAADYKLTGAPGPLFVTPDPRPQNAKVWFFTRQGGVSEPPYDSLNVSKTTGDKETAVRKNLELIKETMGGRPSAWVKQVSGDRVVRVSKSGYAGEADALVTDAEGFSLVVAVADCVPVALVGETEVGMVHSGWRGTLAGISGRAAREMKGGKVRAYIGPGIRECCYEVSQELADEFAGKFAGGVVSGRYLSLPKAIKKDLEASGVDEVYDLRLCTGCRPDLFYSHRKQGPRTGRTLAAVANTSP